MLRIMITAGTVALMAGAASAADIVTYDPAPSPGAYQPYQQGADWTGPYAGITAGYGWGQGTGDPDGLLGGVYGGYNFQTHPNVVLGIEGDATITGKDGTSGSHEISNPWNATLRGRAGYTHGQTMVYGTAGLAAGGVKAEDKSSDTETGVGWTAGVGLEHILTETMTGRVELRHTDLGTVDLTGFGEASARSTDAMLGLGMRF